MKDTYYRIHRLKNGFNFIYDTDNDILHKFTAWIYDNDLYTTGYYGYLYDYEVETRKDVAYIPEV